MKPYCYIVRDYDDLYVWPTWEELVKFLKGYREPDYKYSFATAYYEDQTSKCLKLQDFLDSGDIVVKPLDEADMNRWVRLQEEAQEIWEKSQKELRDKIARGEKISLSTGCYRFDRHYSREEIVEAYIQNNKYRWA